MKSIFILLLFPLSCFAQTASIFGGRAVSNSITDAHSNAWQIEQETPTRVGPLLLGYLNEGHQEGDKRDGIYALYKLPYQFTDNVQTSFALGPYFTATTVTEPDGVHYRDAYCWSLLGAVGIKYQLDKHWSTQFRWEHVMYAKDNKDSDVFLIGIGWSPK